MIQFLSTGGSWPKGHQHTTCKLQQWRVVNVQWSKYYVDWRPVQPVREDDTEGWVHWGDSGTINYCGGILRRYSDYIEVWYWTVLSISLKKSFTLPRLICFKMYLKPKCPWRTWVLRHKAFSLLLPFPFTSWFIPQTLLKVPGRILRTKETVAYKIKSTPSRSFYFGANKRDYISFWQVLWRMKVWGTRRCFITGTSMKRWCLYVQMAIFEMDNQQGPMV